jgi:hypothetical protein
MTIHAACACERDPIKDVRLEPAADPLRLVVTIELAEHVASCCVNADTAFVEMTNCATVLHEPFSFQEGRPGHRFVAHLTLPETGSYAYRIMAKVLTRTFYREGTYRA